MRITDRVLLSIEDMGGTDLARLARNQRQQIRDLRAEVEKAAGAVEVAERQVRDAALLIERQKAEIARLRSLVPSAEGAR